MSNQPEDVKKNEENLVGDSIKHTTINVDTSAPLYTTIDLHEVATVPIGSIGFCVQGVTDPLVYRDQARIYIGRKSLETPQINFDVTPFQGAEFGVSRLHALIELKDNQYFVTDLGSSNGTILNDKSMVFNQPVVLKHGDFLRLGQLVILVQLNLPNSVLPMETSLPEPLHIYISRIHTSIPDDLFISTSELIEVKEYLDMLAQLHFMLMKGNHLPEGYRIHQLTVQAKAIELVITSSLPNLKAVCQFVSNLQPIAKATMSSKNEIEATTMLHDPLSVQFMLDVPTSTETPNQTNTLFLQLAKRLVNQAASLASGTVDIQEVIKALQAVLELDFGLSLIKPT